MCTREELGATLTYTDHRLEGAVFPPKCGGASAPKQHIRRVKSGFENTSILQYFWHGVNGFAAPIWALGIESFAGLHEVVEVAKLLEP